MANAKLEDIFGKENDVAEIFSHYDIATLYEVADSIKEYAKSLELNKKKEGLGEIEEVIGRYLESYPLPIEVFPNYDIKICEANVCEAFVLINDKGEPVLRLRAK